MIQAPFAVPPTASAAAFKQLEDTARDLSPKTLDGYRKVLTALRRTLEPCPEYPAEFTADHATRFCRLFASSTFSRSKAEGAIQRGHKMTSLRSYMGQLQAVWHHFKALALVPVNPWPDIRKPQVERKLKAVPTEEEVCAFFWWIQKRYPAWRRLHALLDLKALSGCRTNDIIQLRTDQLQGGCVVWEAAQMKQRQGRTVRVPAEFFKVLQEVAGPVYLWERITQDLHDYRPSRQIPAEFKPATVAHLIGNLFKEYRKLHPGLRDFSPHALRRRAVTLITTEAQSLDVAAEALGVTPATARRSYLDRQRALKTDDVFTRTAGLLIPPKLSPN